MNYSKAPFAPNVGDCYGHGWKILWQMFLPLLLVGIVYVALSIVINILSFLITYDEISGIIIYIVIVIAYGILVLGPAQYGVYYAYLKAVRGENVDVQDIFSFKENYLNVVIANVLTSFIIVIGVFLLIIPGIIFACKLAFVPYLVMDRKMDAMEAIKKSWEMTDGHAVNIFVIGLLSIFISIGGFIAFLVGIIIAAMWITLALASMYYAVESMQDLNNTTEAEVLEA
jgi:hypothetical protein